MARTRDWPAELRKPITMKELRSRHFGLEFTVKDIQQRYVAECVRRVDIMRNFFQISKSLAEAKANVLLVVRLCRYWKISGFEIAEEPRRGPGAPRIWTPQKQCEVFADVVSLVKRSQVTEHRACQILAERQRYKERYKDMLAKTIHREFLRAKKTISGDPWFRATYFRQHAFRGLLLDDIPTFGPELIEMAIQRYAIAQKSKPNNSA
jgi:hypothetical protein